MMKLLVDSHVFDGIPQGSRTYIQGLYTELINRHLPNLIIYMGAYDIENLKEIFGTHENVVYVRYKSRNKIYRLAWDIPKIIKTYQIDYAHFQYMLPLWKCCREIVTIHDILFIDFPHFFNLKFRFLYNFLFRIAANRAEILLTVSKYSQEKISQHYNINKDKIYITPNAVTRNNTYSDQWSSLDDNRFILYVSRIEERKNHVALIKAFVESKLWEENIRLIMAGYVSQKVKELKALISSLPENVTSKIVFCTPDDNELEQLFETCTLFVYPSLAEGFGIPPLEAAMHLKPVLCSNNTAMKEFSEIGFNMFDPTDIKDFAEKMSECVHSPISKEERYRIANQIAEKYNWANGADVLQKLILHNI